MIRESRRRLNSVLDGVGFGGSVETVRRIAIHLRRSLSPEEMATISCEWLAIPAIDMFSEDENASNRPSNGSRVTGMSCSRAGS